MQIYRRINSQYSFEEKLKKIQEAIKRDNHGFIEVFDINMMKTVLKNVGYPIKE